MTVVPLSSIDPPAILMREVDKTSEDYIDLVRSMKQHGLHNSILVRPKVDRYELVDGNYRLTVARELGWTEIDTIVRPMSDPAVLACQLQANAIRPKTSRVEFAKQLLRIQGHFPGITMAELANYAGKSAYWVRQQLDLLKLRLEYQTLVDRGIVPILNAYLLSKLPDHRQGHSIEAAINSSPEEFKVLIGEEITRLQSNAKERSEQARTSAIQEPPPYLRQLKELSKELQSKSAAQGLIAEVKPDNAVDAFLLGVKWAMHVDPLELEDRKAKYAENRVSQLSRVENE